MPLETPKGGARGHAVLFQANIGRPPAIIGEKRKVKVACCGAAGRRRAMPGAYEVGALLQGVGA